MSELINEFNNDLINIEMTKEISFRDLFKKDIVSNFNGNIVKSVNTIDSELMESIVITDDKEIIFDIILTGGHCVFIGELDRVVWNYRGLTICDNINVLQISNSINSIDIFIGAKIDNSNMILGL